MTGAAVVVDTDVISFLLKDDSRAQTYRPHLEDKTLVLSFMTVAELYQWAYQRNWGEKRLAWLEARLHTFVVAPYDNELCRCWAITCVERQRLGKPISAQDAWIAATAVRHEVPLVTHNQVDFADITGLTIISESGR
jgi:tRNA(fMet)-specific endonuclease VapC